MKQRRATGGIFADPDRPLPEPRRIVRIPKGSEPGDKTVHRNVPLTFAVVATALLAAGVAIAAKPPSQPDSAGTEPGLDPWPAGASPMGGMMGGGMSGISLPRHHAVMHNGVPAPYTNLVSPLPKTRATVERGRAVYEKNCTSCHGEAGAGDGPAARALVPHPAYLALLSQMPIAQWDSFMYWTVAEGGKPVGSAMPAFKATLSKDDTWAVIAYIQAHLPRKTK